MQPEPQRRRSPHSAGLEKHNRLGGPKDYSSKGVQPSIPLNVDPTELLLSRLDGVRKAGKATVANIKAQFADFLRKPLSAITAWNVEKFKADRLRAGIKPATVNRDLVRIRACLAKAVEWGALSVHPLQGVKRAKGDDDSRTRYVSTLEEKALRNALAKLRLTRRNHLPPLVLLAMNTGLRRGELFSLTWGDIDLKRALLTVRAATAKGQRARHIPLNKEALAALRAWKPKDDEADAIVFPGIGGGRLTNVNKSWAHLVEQAKLTNFRFHDLRHNFASKLVMAGVDLYVVKELLGHSDFAMTQTFEHGVQEQKCVEQLLRDLGDARRRAVTRERSPKVARSPWRPPHNPSGGGSPMPVPREKAA